MRAQALVEFALVLPVFLLLGLGFGEAAFLFATQHGYQEGADVLAGFAAYHARDVAFDAEWPVFSLDELDRIGCDGSASISFPDGNREPGSRIVVGVTCKYRPRITANLWAGLPISVDAIRVVEGFGSSSSMSPAASPSSLVP